MEKLVFAIGDIHGDYHVFCELLKDYDPTRHQLVLIGDLNDRGKHSKECLLLGMKLVVEDGAIYLQGNHEELLLKFVKDPENMFYNYLYNGGGETLNSLLHSGATEEYSPTEMSMMLKKRYGKLLAFLEELPLYFEWKDYVFVHAGVDLRIADWRKTSRHDFVWIREDFHKSKNKTGKTIIFGHTVTPMLHGDNQTTDLWVSDNKIGIDGGGIYGGSNHAVIFNAKEIIQDIEIQQLGRPWQPSF